MRNARFWVYINGGPVKLTLKPGQKLEWSEAHMTDEGWRSEYHSWEHGGDFVWSSMNCLELDCDGRLDRYGDWSCPLENLKSGHVVTPWDGASREEVECYADVVYPEWQKESASQRDYAAEAAGY
jgi:hypothetical protein